jgi:glutaconate CoA-transferase subunit A
MSLSNKARIEVEKRKEKVVSMEDAVNSIKDNSSVAIGGSHAQIAPMALIRNMIKKGVRGLKVYPSVSAGVPADFLIGGGCVETIYVSYIGLEKFGLAPNFRRAVESGSIEVKECCEVFIVYGLKAGGSGLPFCVLPKGHQETSLLSVNPDYKTITDPYSGEEVITIPAITPDIGIIHVARCDPYGNCLPSGSLSLMLLIAQAAKHVIVTCEKVVSLEETTSKGALIPGFLVDMVVEIPYGAHPTSCHGEYAYDEKHLEMYLKADPQEYFQEYVHDIESHAEYLEKIGRLRLLSLRY